MKKLLFLFASIALFSCSKSDDDNSNTTPTTGNIVSKWNLTDILENGKSVSGYSCNKEFDVTEFFANGNSVIAYADKNSKNVCVQFFEEATYTIEDNLLTEIQKEGSVKVYEAKYKIKELTETSLKLEEISLYEYDVKGNKAYTSTYAEGESVKIYTKIK